MIALAVTGRAFFEPLKTLMRGLGISINFPTAKTFAVLAAVTNKTLDILGRIAQK